MFLKESVIDSHVAPPTLHTNKKDGFDGFTFCPQTVSLDIDLDNNLGNNIKIQQLYQQLENTKEYQETYWFGLSYEKITKNVIPLNKYWCEFAKHLLHENENENEEIKFLSKWILLTTSNIHEIICALAILDLPFQSNGPIYNYYNNNNIPLKLVCNDENNGGCIIFVKNIT
eukprot:492241_1